ncbi:MAG: hypothetical protein ACYDHD_00215 [Vulcanimicrobiaceae bacterium]
MPPISSTASGNGTLARKALLLPLALRVEALAGAALLGTVLKVTRPARWYL